MSKIEVIVVSGPIGPQGPQGLAGTGLVTLSGVYPLSYDITTTTMSIVSGYYTTFDDLAYTSGVIVEQITGGGEPVAPSGYATGLFSGPTNADPIIRATTDNFIEVLGDGASGTAPPSSNLSMLVVQPIHGSTGNLLGEPDGWWSILVSGRSARIPYYFS